MIQGWLPYHAGLLWGSTVTFSGNSMRRDEHNVQLSEVALQWKRVEVLVLVLVLVLMFIYVSVSEWCMLR